jgi:molybdopterin-binding protein
MLEPAGPVAARIESLVLGVQLAHVVVRLSENRLVETFIPRSYAEELNLRMGYTVITRVTESEVLFQRNEPEISGL